MSTVHGAKEARIPPPQAGGHLCCVYRGQIHPQKVKNTQLNWNLGETTVFVCARPVCVLQFICLTPLCPSPRRPDMSINRAVNSKMEWIAGLLTPDSAEHRSRTLSGFHRVAEANDTQETGLVSGSEAKGQLEPPLACPTPLWGLYWGAPG